MATIPDQGKTGADTTAKPGLCPYNDDEEPISTMVKVCESNFSRSISFTRLNGERNNADILENLRAKFVDWAANIGVFAAEDANSTTA